MDPLLTKLPTDGYTAGTVIAMDLDEARRQLHLALRADPRTIRLTQLGMGRGRFPVLVERALGGLLNPAPQIQDTPVAQAIDTGAISASAGNWVHGEDEVTAIATDQDFDEIAGELERLGLDREGPVLVERDPERVVPSFSVVADAGDGVVVLAGSREAALAALRRDELSPAAELVRSVGGAIRCGSRHGTDDENCVRGLALGQDLEPPEGEILVRVEGDADVDDFTVPPLSTDREKVFQFGSPTASGDEDSTPISYDPEALLDEFFISVGPIGLIGDPSPLRYYDCE